VGEWVSGILCRPFRNPGRCPGLHFFRPVGALRNPARRAGLNRNCVRHLAGFFCENRSESGIIRNCGRRVCVKTEGGVPRNIRTSMICAIAGAALWLVLAAPKAYGLAESTGPDGSNWLNRRGRTAQMPARFTRWGRRARG